MLTNHFPDPDLDEEEEFATEEPIRPSLVEWLLSDTVQNPFAAVVFALAVLVILFNVARLWVGGGR